MRCVRRVVVVGDLALFMEEVLVGLRSELAWSVYVNHETDFEREFKCSPILQAECWPNLLFVPEFQRQESITIGVVNVSLGHYYSDDSN